MANRRTMGRFQLSSGGGSKGAGSVPSGNLGKSKSGNPAGMGFLIGAMMGQKMAAQQRQSVAQNLSQVAEQLPNNELPSNAKINIGENTSISVPMGKDLTLDESRAVANADAFDAHAQYLDAAMSKMPRAKFINSFQKATARVGGPHKGQIFGVPTTYGDSDAQIMNFALTDMGDRLLRLRSGAQVNTQEMERLTSLLPSWSDVSDPNDVDYRTIKTKLFSFVNELRKIKKLVLEGHKINEKTGEVVKYNPSEWEDFEKLPGNVVNHPAYQAYLNQKKKSSLGPGMGQSSDDDPLGVFN